ncbi:MAG: sulfurtransferase, partial [Candidatus Competibacter sp.]|nr:sulfurtransferase [Candidatus Competibacter sp.]
MTAAPNLPLLIEPEQLQPYLADPGILIVDLSNPARHATGHIPGAVHLDYSELIRVEPPAMGLLPDEARLGEACSRLGLTPERPVVAYDDEGNGRAGRLLWTLAVLGHEPVSLLNGGIDAWNAAGGPLEARVRHPSRSVYPARFANPAAVADKNYILERIGHADVALLDTRTLAEFAGLDQRAARGGHIPGAVNLNWTDAMDPRRQLRLQPDPVLRELLATRGVTPDKEVIVYCQTHHRSAHTYWVLRYLGYPR